jgi:8-oxo-dGTP pyrophosphatase MutT (NUDIX family)
LPRRAPSLTDPPRPVRDRIVNAVKPLESPEPEHIRPELGDHDLNGPPPPRAKLRPAAVLVPIVERPDEPTVLFTRRTDHLHDHAGQVSFPGGRIEPSDSGPVAGALRETQEEIGLARGFVDVVGLLDDYETVTRYRVTPVVGFVTPGFTLTLDEFEVAEVFEVPLSFLLDPGNHRTDHFMRDGVRRRFYAFDYEGKYIWGATAGMFMSFYRRLRG